MNINDLLPDREICQEAQDKGVVIESSFWYKVGNSSGAVNIVPEEMTDIGNISFSYCPAPLTDEIMPKLPQQFGGQDLEIVKLPHDIYSCGYPRDIMGRGINYYQDKKLSNALFLLAIKLKEMGIKNI